MIDMDVDSETITLIQFLKVARLVPSGGIAKVVIDDERVQVNGEICSVKKQTLNHGDVVKYEGEYRVNYLRS